MYALHGFLLWGASIAYKLQLSADFTIMVLFLSSNHCWSTKSQVPTVYGRTHSNDPASCKWLHSDTCTIQCFCLNGCQLLLWQSVDCNMLSGIGSAWAKPFSSLTIIQSGHTIRVVNYRELWKRSFEDWAPIITESKTSHSPMEIYAQSGLCAPISQRVPCLLIAAAETPGTIAASITVMSLLIRVIMLTDPPANGGISQNCKHDGC